MHNSISAACCKTNGLTGVLKKAFFYGQIVSLDCGRKRLCDIGDKLPRLCELRGLPFAKNDTSAGARIQSLSFREAEKPFRATMGSDLRRSGFGDRVRDEVPSDGTRWMDESEYPPLSASSSKAIRDSSGEGKGRLLAEKNHAHVSRRPQQLADGGRRFTDETERPRDSNQNRQSVDTDRRDAGDGHGAETEKRLKLGDQRGGWKIDGGHSYVSGKRKQRTQRGSGFGEGTERQENLNQNRQSVDHDEREPGDREGAKTRKGRETGERRSGWKNDQAHHTYISSRSHQQSSRVSGWSEGAERQGNSNQDRQRDDLHNRVFREEMERQENLNKNRNTVDHDRRELGDREGAETGKGRETAERRNGLKNDQVHDTYASSTRSQQNMSRVSRWSDGTERQRNSNQDRLRDDLDNRVFREGTERQEILNLNRNTVDHDRRDLGDREGAETGKGRETGERRIGLKNDQVHDTYASSTRSQQNMSRVSRWSDGPERQRNSNQDKQRDDLDRRVFREGTERQKFSNENRRSVHPYGREAGDRQDATWENIDALGRTMSRILRHQAAQLNLQVSSDGYVNVRDLLKLPMKTRSHRPLSSHNIDEVKLAVEQDNKQRFGIKEDNGQLFIRANQGHTMKEVKTEHLLKPIVSAHEIPTCVHGTYRRVLDQILEEGLKRMERNHVHFATGVLGSDGVISGMRATVQVLIYLNVDKALADGMKLYMSENKVILTEGFEGVVPPQYFKEVLSLPGMRPIAHRTRRG